MDEREIITGQEGSKPQPPFTESSKTLCKDCGELEADPGKDICGFCETSQRRREWDEREAAKARQKLIDDSTESEYLDSILSRAMAGFESLVSLADEAENETALGVLQPLTEHLKATLTKTEAVIASTLGHIAILTCTAPLRIDGKVYAPGDFFQAILGPKESRD